MRTDLGLIQAVAFCAAALPAPLLPARGRPAGRDTGKFLFASLLVPISMDFLHPERPSPQAIHPAGLQGEFES